MKKVDLSNEIKTGIQDTIRITGKNRKNIAQLLVINRNTDREYKCIEHIE